MIAQTPAPIVSFARLPAGWHQPAGLPGLALNWPYHPNSSGWAPSMPRDGIVVHAFFVNDPRRFAPLRLVLPRAPATTLEGAPDTPEYRILGSIDGHDVEVWVDIRRPHPTREQLRLAERVVSAIRIT